MFWLGLCLTLFAFFWCLEPRRRKNNTSVEIALVGWTVLGLLGTAILQLLTAPDNWHWFIHVLGAQFYIAGRWVSCFALEANPYAVPELVKPPEIVRDGIYKYCSHPYYWGQLLAAAGAFMLLGQMWAAWPLTLYYLVIFNRIRREDHLLIQC
jgi:protein-S-isoprenylcysteine O-methyltransferase Ste14